MDTPKTLAAVTVVTAGTRVPLSATPIFAHSVRVTGDYSNAGNIFIGDRNVSSSRYTDKLAAGDFTSYGDGLYDLSRMFIDADTNGSKAQVTYVPA